MSINRVAIYVAPAAGLLVLLAYLNFTVFGVPISERLAMVLAFAIGPVAVAGMLQIYQFLSARFSGGLLRMAMVFLVVAFSLFTTMLVVQQTLFSYYHRQVGEAADEPAKQALRQIFGLVNSVQLGLDVTFDIFYCIGLIFLSFVLIQLSLYKKLLGAYGLVTGVGLLAFNIGTFPVPPAESGLIDLGPATGVFWIILIVMMIREQRTNNRADKPLPVAT